MAPVKVGVIGVGHLGRFHALNYSQMPGAELVGVTDVDAARAEGVAAEAHCRAFPDSESLLSAVEAVSVAVPTDRHFEAGSAVLKKGVHLLIEKPITRTLDEAEALIGLARKAGVILHVGQVERFNPGIQALAGFGLAPRFIEAHRLAPFNPRGTEVSVILDLMIHDIDILLHLIPSEIKRVDASGVAVVSGTADIANARIQFANGAVANLTASRISQKKMRKMRLFQRDAYLSVDFLERTAEIYALESETFSGDMTLGEIGVGDRKRKIAYRRPDVPDKQGLQLELEAFVRAVRGEKTEAADGEAGKRALAIAMEVLKCMEV
jgi:predicted dehydrogenase